MADISTALDSYAKTESGLEANLNALKGKYETVGNEAEAALKEKGTALEGAAKEMRGYQAQIQQFGKDNPYPHPDIKPWTEKPPQSNPLQDFGSWASAFGIVASALTKTPLQNALNASAAAIRAQQQGRWDQYDEAKKVWKENTESAIKNAEFEGKRYQAAWDLMKTNQTAGMAALQSELAVHDMPAALAQLKAGNLDKVWEMTKGVADFAAQGPERMARMQELATKVEEARDRRLLWDEKQKDPEFQKLTPEQKAAAMTQILSPQYTINQAKTIAETSAPGGAGSIASDPVAISYWAKRVRAGESMPAMGYGRDAAMFRRQVAQQAARDAYDGGGSAEGDIVKKATLRAESESLKKQVAQQHAIDQFEKTAMKNADIALSLVDKVDSTGSPVIERWLRGGRKAIAGDTDVTNFDFQIGVLVPEIARILNSPNLSSVLSDSARTEAQSLIDGNITAQQLRELLPLMKGDFQRRSDAIQEEIDVTQDTIKALGSMDSKSLKEPSQDATHPPVPDGVPKTAQWSASGKEFWWQENGEWKHRGP